MTGGGKHNAEKQKHLGSRWGLLSVKYIGSEKDWAFLVAQLAKNPPAMQETWVRSLGWEDPLEKGKATHSSILA